MSLWKRLKNLWQLSEYALPNIQVHRDSTGKIYVSQSAKILDVRDPLDEVDLDEEHV